MVPTPRVTYLTNKELLAEIHKSKSSYCYFTDPKYSAYDAIITSLSDITPELIQATQEAKAKKQHQALRLAAKDSGLKPHQIKVPVIDPETLPVEELVWRVMTFDHIPLDAIRVKKPKKESDDHTKLLFPPFKHYILEDGEPREVGRSHWRYALDNGEFCQEHGKMTRRLALMFMKLVERYGQRGNWRGYSYVDEMKSQALLQLSMVGLQFDESRSDNPFAYYTVTVSNAFTRVLNLEKRCQNIRDDLLEIAGVTPSHSRQMSETLPPPTKFVRRGRTKPA